MNPEKLKAFLEAKKAQKAKMAELAEKSQNPDEIKSLTEQLKALNEEIAMLEDAIKPTAPEEPSGGNEAEARANNNMEARSQTFPNGVFNPLGTYTMNNAQNQQPAPPADPFDTVEYRSAFRAYVVSGTPIPDKYREQRAAELTVVGDIGAVIPTTIMNKVIEQALAHGMILPRVTQTNFQGGVEIPVSDIKPTATWITEDTVSDTQKKTVSGKITFSYYILECRIALGLLAATVALPIFETIITKNLKEAMIIALETAVIKGTGSGQPKGIITETVPAERAVTLDATTIGTVSGWAGVEAAVPLAYESGAVYLMAKTTWEKYINGATDSNGQKIGFVGISENQKKVLSGREVILTDYLPGFDAASAGDVFAILVKLEDYYINSNLAMYFKKYFNDDTNKWVHKGLMIADGKMADTYGLVLIKKG